MAPKSLVLGGAGFIGSHLVEALLKEGHKVTVFDKIGIKTDNLEKVLDEIELIEGDFLDEHFLEELPKGMDYVFHLVSTTLPATSNLNPVYDVQSNLAPSVKLIEQCVAHKIKKFFFISSGGTIYGIPEKTPIPETHPKNPINSYAITKLGVEKFLHLYHHLHGLDYVVLRLSNPYGPRQPFDKGQGVIAVFIHNILSGKPLEVWGDGAQLRDYLYIEDAINAFIAVLKKETPSKIYNFGSGEPTSVNDIIRILREVSGRDIKVVYKPSRSADVPENYLDISRAKTQLGWKPNIGLMTGIKFAWNWYYDKGYVHD
jgi:UDP-glucose 4-epimerase